MHLYYFLIEVSLLEVYDLIMAHVFGADTYLINQKNDHSLNGIFLIYIYLIGVITYWVYIIQFHFPEPSTEIFAVFMVLMYVFLNKPINREIKLRWDYIYGLDGELTTQKILATLPDDYYVFSNVVLPGKQSNIDFVVVGPTGIYTIEVKSHKGKISYDGQQLLRYGRRFEHNFLWQAKSEAKDLYGYLKGLNNTTPFIEPIIVFSNTFTSVRFGDKSIDGVTVIGKGWIQRYFSSKSAKIVLLQDQIEKIVSKLKNLLFQSTIPV